MLKTVKSPKRLWTLGFLIALTQNAWGLPSRLDRQSSQQKASSKIAVVKAIRARPRTTISVTEKSQALYLLKRAYRGPTKVMVHLSSTRKCLRTLILSEFKHYEREITLKGIVDAAGLACSDGSPL